MFINCINMVISFLLGIIFFYLGYKLSGLIKTLKVKILLSFVILIFCIPALSFVMYYLHLINETTWYVEFRSIPYIEISSSMICLFFGFICFRNNKNRKVKLELLNKYFFIISLLIVFVPFSKPILLPIDKNIQFNDQWENGVCIQSTYSTCGPASMATVFKYYGHDIKEKEIAQNSYSSSRGTENWYMIRYARLIGYSVEVLDIDNLNDVPIPSIIGTYINNIGHFITVLGVKEDRYIIGDPLIGKLFLTKEEFEKRYKYTGRVLYFRYASLPHGE